MSVSCKLPSVNVGEGKGCGIIGISANDQEARVGHSNATVLLPTSNLSLHGGISG